MSTEEKIIKIGDNYFKEILSPEVIEAKVKEIAKKVSLDYANSDSLVLLIVTNGGLYFGIALSMALQDIGVIHSVETISITRCAGDEKFMKDVEVSHKSSMNLSGKNVLVVEDLIDEGFSMNFLDSYLKTTESMKPESIEYCVLVEKRGYAKLSFSIKYSILDNVGPEWLAGFGMDSNLGWRGLRGIYAKMN